MSDSAWGSPSSWCGERHEGRHGSGGTASRQIAYSRTGQGPNTLRKRRNTLQKRRCRSRGSDETFVDGRWQVAFTVCVRVVPQQSFVAIKSGRAADPDCVCFRMNEFLPLVPAKAGTQYFQRLRLWIPACAGMSGEWGTAMNEEPETVTPCLPSGLVFVRDT